VIPEDALTLPSNHGDIPLEYGGFKEFNPLVVFLGTGSMKPGRYRNVSGIYVELHSN
jgi:hypothetical protein